MMHLLTHLAIGSMLALSVLASGMLSRSRSPSRVINWIGRSSLLALVLMSIPRDDPARSAEMHANHRFTTANSAALELVRDSIAQISRKNHDRSN